MRGKGSVRGKWQLVRTLQPEKILFPGMQGHCDVGIS